MDLPGLAMGLQVASAAAGLLCCLVAFGAIILRRGATGDTQKVRMARKLVHASLFSLTAYAGSVTALAALHADGAAGLAPGAALLPEALLTHGGLVALLLATAVLIDKRMVPPRNSGSGARLRISLVLPALALASWSALTGLAVASTDTVVPATAVYASTAVLWAAFLAGGATVAHLHRTSGGTPRGAHPARPGAPQRPPRAQVIPFPGPPPMQIPAMQAPRPKQRAADPQPAPAPVTAGDVIAQCRPALVGVAGISLVTNLLMLTGPLYMLQVYDRVLTSRSIETLIALTIVLVVLYAAMSMLEHIRAKVLARVAVRIDRLLAPHLLANVLSARQSKPEGTHTAPLRDLDTLRQFVSGPAPGAMFDLPWTPLYFGIIFLMHPLLGLVALAGAAVLWSLSLLNETVTRKPMAEAAEGMARGHTLAETGKRDAETLHAMGMIGTFRQRWIADHTQVLSKQVAAADTANGYAVATRVSRLLLQSLVLAMGAYLTLYDLVSPGAMIAASIITARALAPVEQLVAQWRGVIAARAAFSRCRDRLDALETSPSRIDLPAPQGRLSVANLFISAGNRKEPVLKGLRFALEPGQALAVIGASASGKSTLARALVGVVPPRHGEIRLDGAMLDQWDPERLGRYIGYLPQEVRLLDGTIAENIARFAPNPDAHSVLDAAAQAGVHDMILSLPQGYATLVGDGGVTLSGGQRQRIALARALYGNPPLVVMDEPNSNLDTDGDAALAAAIERIRMDGRTAVVMAHRKSVLAAVTHILVLKDGRQAAFGSVDQILQRKPANKTGEKANAAHKRAEPGRIGA